MNRLHTVRIVPFFVQHVGKASSDLTHWHSTLLFMKGPSAALSVGSPVDQNSNSLNIRSLI